MGAKRLLVGRPFRSDTIGATHLPKRVALPVFASDALSSVAYAPQEIFLVLSLAGLSALAFTPWGGLAAAGGMGGGECRFRPDRPRRTSRGRGYEGAAR